MSLQYTLLGFLNLAPMTGYDLKKRLDRSTQSFWHAGLNQIYPSLKSLEDTRLITSDLEQQDGRPDRRVYRITADGRGELLDWLAEPVSNVHPRKNVALLKLFFAGCLENSQILHHLRTQLDLHRRELRRYREEVAPMISAIVRDTGLVREGAMWEMVRELGELDERTTVDWLERAISTVEGLE